jgi:predicted Zn finger-like uncharacterized protein
VKFECPSCKARYDVRDERLPTARILRFTCRHCQHEIRVQHPSAGHLSGAALTQGATAPRVQAARDARPPVPARPAAKDFGGNTKVLLKEALDLMMQTRKDAAKVGEAPPDRVAGGVAPRAPGSAGQAPARGDAAPNDATTALSPAELARVREASAWEDKRLSEEAGTGFEAQPETRVLTAADLAELHSKIIEMPATEAPSSSLAFAEPEPAAAESQPRAVTLTGEFVSLENDSMADGGVLARYRVALRLLPRGYLRIGAGFAVGVLVGLMAAVLLRPAPPSPSAVQAVVPEAAPATLEALRAAGLATPAASEAARMAASRQSGASETTRLTPPAGQARSEVSRRTHGAASVSMTGEQVGSTGSDPQRSGASSSAAVQPVPHSKSTKPAARSTGKRAVGLSDPANGCLSITCKPGAIVIIDGETVAKTPARCIELPAGAQDVVLESSALDVHETVRVTIRSGEVTHVTCHL